MSASRSQTGTVAGLVGRWWCFYQLFFLVFFVITRQPPPNPGSVVPTVVWFGARRGSL